MAKWWRLGTIIFLTTVVISCNGLFGSLNNPHDPQSSSYIGGSVSTHTVTYDGNGATSGSVPRDSNKYTDGQKVTVLGNTGGLSETGYAFAGWNTKTDGSGVSYSAGSTFTMGSSNVTLYAFWSQQSTYTISGNVSGASSVTVFLSGNENASTTTDSSGNYSFTGLLSGSYTVTPNIGGYSFSPSDSTVVISGSSVSGVNFTGTSSGAAVPSGYIAYYPFDGNANDTSGDGYNGTVYGATLTTDRFGNANSAYSFNGSSDYITTIPSANIPSSITVGMWLYATSLGTSGTQLWGSIYDPSGGKNGFAASASADGQLSLHYWYQDVGPSPVNSASGVISTNTWEYVTYTYDNSTGTAGIYVNGASVASSSFSLAGMANDEPLMLGIGILLQTQSFFAGKIDDVRIYSRALSASEVQSLYNAGG